MKTPIKIMAMQKVGQAVRSGKLVKLPCEKCRSKEWVEGHHEDYTKPLEVIWLCRPCHRKRHVEMGTYRIGNLAYQITARFGEIAWQKELVRLRAKLKLTPN